MTRAAGKAAEVFFDNLAIKKAFSATRHRDHVPTCAEDQHHDDAWMQAKLRNQIPSFLQYHEHPNHEGGQHNPQRTLR